VTGSDQQYSQQGMQNVKQSGTNTNTT